MGRGRLFTFLLFVAVSCVGGPGPQDAPAAADADAPHFDAGGRAAPPDTAVSSPLPEGIPGFGAASEPRQRELERRFLAVPASDSAAATARWLSSAPHMAGTPGQEAIADSLAAVLGALGFEVRIERFRIHLPHPRTLRLALTAPERRELELREDLRRRSVGERRDHVPTIVGAPGHPSPGILDRGAGPATAASRGASDSLYSVGWNAYSANGTVEAPVVHVGSGLPEDYREARRSGIDPEGKIALARYGGAYRGVKVREAERRGAVGLILYTHPEDGGHATGDTLPHGPHRPAGSLQRGTVSYLDVHPGDPLTPGRGATDGEEVRRIDPGSATNLPSIPVLPVSWTTAERILAGDGAEPEHRDRPVRVRMEVSLDYRLRTIRNVIARLPGRGDRQVILGNHYDAWVFGGVDPHAGTAALMEVARGLGALIRDGWRPRREIVLAFWDAEEFGAAGSTEFVESRLSDLRERAVAYLNVDMFTAGTLDVAGSPSLRDLVVSAAGDVEDPVTGEPLSRGWIARQRNDGPSENDASDADRVSASDRRSGRDGESDSPIALPRLAPLGAGSDWTAFFHHAGVPSLQWTMNGRGHYGVYHSSLDDFAYQATFADSAFLHTPALARVMGLTALRLAEADALPFRYERYADRISEHLDELLDRRAATGAPGAREEREERKARKERDVLLPGEEALRSRIRRLRAAAVTMRERQQGALAVGDTAGLREIDRRLLAVERAFLDPRGMPGRPWYRHRIYAADTRTGYGSLPLPGVAEALRDDEPRTLETAVAGLRGALDSAITTLEAVR